MPVLGLISVLQGQRVTALAEALLGLILVVLLISPGHPEAALDPVRT